MKEKFIHIILLVVFLIIPLICFQNCDIFTSAEIDIPFKTLNENDTIILKDNILVEEKDNSIDITSSKQLLYISYDYFPNKFVKKNIQYFIIFFYFHE